MPTGFDSALLRMQMVNDERFAEAIETLGPLAYSAHENEISEKALALLKDVEARLQANPPEATDASEQSAESTAPQSSTAQGSTKQ